MTKITKGTNCYRFQNWDSKGTFSVVAVTVESWGKKQATIRVVEHGGVIENGQMADERIYVELHSAEFVPVADCEDPLAEGQRRAEAWIADQIEWSESHISCGAHHVERLAELRTFVARSDWQDAL